MGKLLIFSAPSGSGKTTIVKEVINRIPGLEFSVSACSRLPRPNELHGKDYYFFSIKEFKQRIDNHEFIEWEEVYPNQFYGTLKSEIDRIWAKGHHLVFDVDVLGGINIKKQFPENSLSFFIQAPTLEVLRSRLKNRGTETDSQIEKRIGKAEHEMGFAKQFDKIIVNNRLEEAIEETVELITEFTNR